MSGIQIEPWGGRLVVMVQQLGEQPKGRYLVLAAGIELFCDDYRVSGEVLTALRRTGNFSSPVIAAFPLAQVRAVIDQSILRYATNEQIAEQEHKDNHVKAELLKRLHPGDESLPSKEEDESPFPKGAYR